MIIIITLIPKQEGFNLILIINLHHLFILFYAIHRTPGSLWTLVELSQSKITSTSTFELTLLFKWLWLSNNVFKKNSESLYLANMQHIVFFQSCIWRSASLHWRHPQHFLILILNWLVCLNKQQTMVNSTQ